MLDSKINVTELIEIMSAVCLAGTLIRDILGVWVQATNGIQGLKFNCQRRFHRIQIRNSHLVDVYLYIC